MRAGFSLLEMVFALAITVLLGIATTRSLTHILRSGARSAEVQQVRMVLRTTDAAHRLNEDPVLLVRERFDGWAVQALDMPAEQGAGDDWIAWRVGPARAPARGWDMYFRNNDKTGIIQ